MKSTTPRLIALIGISMLAAHWVQAANSTWNGGTANWGVAGNWNGGLTSATQTALFNAVFANQPNLSGTSSTAQGIWLATGAGQSVALDSTPAGATLTVTGNATLGTGNQASAGIILDDGANDSLSLTSNVGVTLSNNTGFYVNNAGTLTLSGTLNLNGKTLTLGGTNASGSTVINGNISASAGAVTVNTSGSVTLGGSNSQTGATTVTSGTLVVKNRFALQSTTITSIAGALVFDNAVTSGTYTFGNLSLTGTASGANNLMLQNNAATPSPVTLEVGGANTSGTDTAFLSGSGSLVKNGSSLLNLAPSVAVPSTVITSGTNVVRVPAGTVVYVGQSVTSSGFLPSGGYVTAVSGTQVTLSISGTASTTTGTATFAGNVFTGGMTVNSGTLNLGTSSILNSGTALVSGPTGKGPVSFASGATLANSSGVTWYLPSLYSTGTLNLAGGNRLTLSTNTWDLGGGTVVNIVSGGKWVAITTSGSTSTSGTNGSGTSNSESTGISQWELNYNTGNLTIQNGTLDLESSGYAASTGTYAAFRFSTPTGFTSFSGNSNLIVGKSVLAFLNGAFNTANAPRVTINAGGFVDAVCSNNTFYSLSGSGIYANSISTTGSSSSGSSTLTINGTSGTATFAGILQDGPNAQAKLNLTKSGASTQILSGSNTYSGSTTVSGGTLIIASGGSVSGTCIAAGGSLIVNGSLSAPVVVYNGATVSGTGSIGSITTSGNVTAGNGSSTDVFTTGQITFGNGATLGFNLGGANSSAIVSNGAVFLGGTSSDVVQLVVNIAAPPVSSSAYTILSGTSFTRAGSLSYNGTNLTDGSQFAVQDGSNADVFTVHFGATGITLTFNQSLVWQTINFPGFYQKTIGDADFSLAATASSGLPVTYTSLDTSVATIVSGKVHIVGPGIAKIQADQTGNSAFFPAPPVVKYFTVVNDGSVTWSRTPENELFQYSYSASYTWPTDATHTGNATITPTAYLWIPENCSTLKGLIIMENNVPEHMLVGHPAIRKTAADNSLGIVFFTPTNLYNFNTGYSQDANDTYGLRATLRKSLQSLLNGLASVSGYSEVATVPWIPMGESGALLLVTGIVDGAPDRCIAGVCMKNPQGLNTAAVKSGGTITLDGSGAITYTGTGIAVSVSPVPMLMSKGTGYEWAQTGTSNNILTAWNTDTQYGSIVSWRSSATNWPLTMIQEAGTGHFWMSEPMAQYIAEYLGKICARRIAGGTYNAITNPLNTINVTTGYLADPPLPGYTDLTIYPYSSSPSVAKSWFPDVPNAQKGQAISNADWTAQTQLPNIDDTNAVNCTVSKYSFTPTGPNANSITQIFVNATSTFGVTPILEPVVPTQFAVATGSALAQSPAGAYTDWICGPIIPNGNNTYRVSMDRSYGSATYFMSIADKTSNPSSIRLSVQPIATNLNKNTTGSTQTITFPQIADVPAGTSSIPLSAASSAGLPVSFSVISGPAVVKDSNLIFTKIPPNAKFPVPVVVRAWQWGSAVSPQVQTATVVNQTFNLVKGSQIITFPSLATHAVGDPDFNPGATASSALPVTYSSDNSGVVTVNSDGTLHIVGAGTAHITASQPGDVNFPAATSVTNLLTVNSAVQSWRLANFGTTDKTGSYADSADYDGDGLTNIQEYVFGTNPTTLNTGGLLTIAPSGTGNITLTFFAIQAGSGAGYAGFTRHYAVETSTSLTSWAAFSGYSDVVGANNTITITLPVSGTKNFYRLKAWLQ